MKKVLNIVYHKGNTNWKQWDAIVYSKEWLVVKKKKRLIIPSADVYLEHLELSYIAGENVK